MNILHAITSGGSPNAPMGTSTKDELWMRNFLEDVKAGLDLVHELKLKLDTLHPLAAETIISLLSR